MPGIPNAHVYDTWTAYVVVIHHLSRMRSFCGRITLVALLAALCIVAPGQSTDRITFRLIGLREGSPYGAVNCLHMDRRGLLWVGMRQGLAVYDGHTFTPVTLGKEERPITPNQLVEDEDGTIWAVGKVEGVVRIDALTHQAELLALPASLKGGASILWPTAVGLGPKGTILVGSGEGTFKLDKATRKYKPLLMVNGDPLKVISNGSGFVADSTRQGLWIGTPHHGLVFYSANDDRLFDGEKDRGLSPLLNEKLTSVCVDPGGGIWAADNHKDEIVHWDKSTGAITRTHHLPGLPDTKVGDMMYMGMDRQGVLWGCSWDHGGFRFDPRDGTSSWFHVHDNRPGALPFGYIRDALDMPDGTIWLANLQGIAIHDPDAPQVRVIDANKGIELGNERSLGIGTIAVAGDSVLWAATDPPSFVRIDTRSGKVRRGSIENEAGDRLWIRDPLVLRDGVMVNTTDGIWRIDDRLIRATRVELRDDSGHVLPHRLHSWLTTDAAGLVWSAFGDQVYRFDPRTNTARTFSKGTGHSGWHGDGALSCGLGTSDGRFWVGIGSAGLAVYDPQRDSWEEFSADVDAGRLRSTWITAMAESPDGSLWLATNASGLVKYDPRSRVYTTYDQRHGFRAISLTSVQFDRMGRVWVGSSEGAMCFDPRTERAVRVDARSDQPFDDLSFGSCTSESGVLYFADRIRIIGFDPNKVRFGRSPPAPRIHRVEMDGEVMPALSEEVVMPHDRSRLRVAYGAVLAPGRIVRYAMRMSGGAWSESVEGVLDIRNLGTGRHTIELRVMNDEGTWGPVTTLHVVRHPAWWQTAWAQALMALLLASIIVLVFRMRLNWIRKRERKEEERTRLVNELRLQAISAQMDPHFVFNSLNSIDRFIIMQRSEEASRYLNRFAKLIRLILHQGDQVTVPLRKETEMLGYYMELEALRFSTPFLFDLKTDPRLFERDLRLPPMLVQPIVENAIWHGLQHKRSQGHLLVDFRLHGDDLVITVEDDGVGREASARINAQRHSDHQSKATEVTANRLELLRRNASINSRIETIDLRNEQGEPTGTRVVITLSLETD